MSNIADWKQNNTDLGFVQSGSGGVSRAGIVVGARSGVPTLHSYDDLRFNFSNNTTHLGLFEDFLGSTAVTAVPVPFESDAGGTPAISYVADQNGGVIRLATGALSGNHTTMTLAPNFKSENGILFFEARVRMAALTVLAVEIGLSDAISETNGEAFSDHTVAGVTDVATEAVVVAFDAAGDANWNALSVKAGTPQAEDTGITPVAATFNVISITIDTTGNAEIRIDGVLTNTLALAVTPTTVLTPWITVVTAAAAAKSIDTDYLGISVQR